MVSALHEKSVVSITKHRAIAPDLIQDDPVNEFLLFHQSLTIDQHEAILRILGVWRIPKAKGRPFTPAYKGVSAPTGDATAA